MGSLGVHSLPVEELNPYLDRRRYSAFAPSRLQVDTFLREILIKANDFVPSGAGSILLDRPFERSDKADKNHLYFVASFGDGADRLLGQELRADRGIVGRVYRTGKSYLMNEPKTDPNFCGDFDVSGSFKTVSAVAVPIRIELAVCGVLELINREDSEKYSEKDLQLLEIFARYTSVSIESLLDLQRANEMARRDDLTGLFNDRFFHHRLTEDLIRADVKDSRVSLIFLDLDNFKDVNDTHGHLAGSQVLKEFGFLLKNVVEDPRATLARYGGDEFVVILPGLEMADAMHVGEAIRLGLRDSEFLQGNSSWADGPIYWREPLTCSVGVAAYPDHVPRDGSTDLKKNLLLRAADQAMYAAKAEGKDRVNIASMDLF
ncbi:MAG: sensor domain-containing diguanylate cyclase [bacterium]|nr:sensor domain-containing diguanylate cyclase [bacterium]